MPYLTPAPGAPAPTETAVIARVSAAEALVESHRDRLDIAASWGVPAHVTLLYPFVPPAAIDESVVNALAEVINSLSAFDCTFARTRWFGNEVLWLDPEPAEPFRRLTSALWTAFPGYPPYGGAHEDVVPHLTIADQYLNDLADRQVAERAVQTGLPLATRIDRVQLIAGAPAASSWRLLDEFSLC